MSRTSKFMANATYGFLHKIIILTAGLVIPRVMLITYGSEINGMVSSIMQFVRYFTLVEAGLASVSVFALFNPLATKDFVSVSKVLVAIKQFYNKAGYFFLALVLACSLIYPVFIRVSSVSPIGVGLLVLILSVPSIFNFFVLATSRALLIADQKQYIISSLLSVAVIVNTVIVVILTKKGFDVVSLRGIAAITAVIAPLGCKIYTVVKYPNVDLKQQPDMKALKKRWDAMVLQVLGLVNSATPLVLATIFTDLKQVSVFSVYSMIMIGVTQVMAVFREGLSSAFGEVIALGDIKLLRDVYNEYEYVAYSILAVFSSCAMVMLLPFIKLYTAGVKDVNYYLPVTSFLFVLNLLFYTIKHPQGMLVLSAGLFKETRWQTATQAFLAVALGIFGAKYWGINGILVGLILSSIYRDFDLILFIPKKLGNTSPIRTFRRVAFVLLEFSVISLTAGNMLGNINNYFEWFFWAVGVFLYSILFVILFGFLFDRIVLLKVLTRVINMVKRIHG